MKHSLLITLLLFASVINAQEKKELRERIIENRKQRIRNN